MNGATHTPDRQPIPPSGLDQIDWHSLRFGGMPAFERILRQLHAGYCELNDRLAEHLATPDAHLAPPDGRDLSISYVCTPQRENDFQEDNS